MKEYQNEELGLRFTLPERPTVRQQLAFRAELASFRTGDDGQPVDDMFTRYFRASLKLIGEWECEAIPDPAQLDVDNETNPRITDIVMWTTNTVSGHINGLENVPGNS